jgi:hypothetical protein
LTIIAARPLARAGGALAALLALLFVAGAALTMPGSVSSRR